MLTHRWQSRLLSVAAVVAFALPLSQTMAAQAAGHLVSPQELSNAAQNATQVRQQNIDKLQSIFSSDKALKALESAHIDPQQVQQAVSSLSDQELAQFAARATKAQNDFAAGASDHDLLLILVVLAAVIVVVAVAAH